jgi:hypothetical protein
MAGGDWQPIETAPRETDVLLFVPREAVSYVVAGLFNNGEEDGWSSALREMMWLDHEPTHWMPLPDPPEGR